MGGKHHGGGWRGAWPGYWGGYPVQYAYPEVFVVNDGNDGQKERALAYVMSLPKGQRAAAYVKIFGKPAPASVLGDWPPYAYQNAGIGMSLDWRDYKRNGGMAAPWTQPYENRAADASSLGGMQLPVPGGYEIAPKGTPLGDCGCGCKGAGTCGMGDVSTSSTLKLAAVAVGAYFLYKHMRKRRR